MTTDTIALALAGASILLTLPVITWLYMWGIRR